MLDSGVRVGFAPDAGPLDANPAYTYLTSIDGLAVQRIETKRGRADERSRMDPGEATITGLDLAGILDPTNPAGPFVDKLDPLKQMVIELQHPLSGEWGPIFTGYLSDLEVEPDVSERFTNWTLTISDALDVFSDAEVVPGSAGSTSVPHESNGDAWFDPQHVDDRILAAIADAATSVFGMVWPADKLSIFSGNVYVQGTPYPARTSLLEVIMQAVDAEFAGVSVFFPNRFGALSFRGRYARFNPEAYIANGVQFWSIGDEGAFAADSEAVVAAGLKFARGKDNLINAALAYPKGVLDADIAGQLVVDAGSIAKYGPRSISFENLITLQGQESGGPLTALLETKSYGHYWVDNMAEPQDRISELRLISQDPDDPHGPAFWDFVCNADLADVANFINTLPGGGGFAARNFIEHLAYTITFGNDRFPQIDLKAELSPAAYFASNPFTP